MKHRLLPVGLIAMLLVMASTVSAQGTADAPTIKIVKPVPNGIVPEERGTIQVSIDNIQLDQFHWWQLYVDDSLAATVQTGVLTTTVPTLTSGPHQFRVALVSGSDATLSSAAVEVTAAPATPTGTVFNRDWMAPAMGVMVAGILILIGLSLRYTRHPAAE